MKIEVEAKEFAAALATVNSVVEHKTTLAVLSCAKLVASGSSVVVTGRDSVREVSVSIPADVEVDGQCAISASVLASIAKVGKSGVVSLALDGDKAKITSGRAKYNISTLDVGQFPTMELAEYVCSGMVQSRSFLSALSTTRHAHCSDVSLYYLQGVHMHRDKKRIAVVATDRHRLALSEFEMPSGFGDMPPIIIPTSTVDLVRNTLPPDGEFKLSVGNRMVRFDMPSCSIVSMLVEGTFPDYGSAVPPPSDRVVLVTEAERVSDGIGSLLAIEAGARAFAVTIRPSSNGVELYARRNSEGREASAMVEAEPGDVTVTLSAAFLREAMSAWPEGSIVRVEQSKPYAPVRITSESVSGMTLIISPMRDQ